MSINDVTGKVLWLKAKDIAGLSDTDAITGWDDASPEGHDATAVAGTKPPRYRTGVTPNGSPAVEFRANAQSSPDTAAGYLTLPNLGLTTAAEAWVVVWVGTTRQALWDFGSSGQESFYRWSDGNIYENFGMSGTRRSFTAGVEVNANWRVYRVRMDAGSFESWVDGTSRHTASGLSVGWRSVPLLGAGRTGSTIDYRFQGFVAELLVFDRAVTGSDETTVWNHLQAEHFDPLGGALNLDPPTATATAAAEVPTFTGLGVALDPPAATATATALEPASITLSGAGGLDLSPDPAAATATALEPTITGAMGAPVLPSDGVNLPAPTPVNTSVTLLPVPAPVPAGVTEWPVQVSAHPMPTLTAGSPRITAALNVQPEPVDYGRYAVFFDGVDVTHLRDVPCEILSHGSARPSGDTAARVSFPQIAPWDQWGVGDLAPFRKDAPVEIGIVRADDSYAFLWEGFWASEGDATGEARESTTLDCEGTFWQADHTIHIPPLHLEPTDIGVLIPRALNAVPARRYAAIPEVTTGILSRERGSQTQSVLAYVHDLLSTAWTDDGRQWTLARVAPYTYRLQLTDITTVHGTITKGAWGVEIDLQRDESTRVDAVYARGVAPSGGVWANWFWPGLDLYTPPPYLYASPATNMTIGATDAGTVSGTGVSDWQRRVNELGYGLTVDGVFNAADAQAARWVQQLRGITVDGIVGPQTWNATWDVGAQALDLTAIRLPLAAKDETEQFLYTANGAVAADNPAWDSGLVRRSIDLNFGADVTKSTARPLAQRYLDMYGEAAWTGRVTISTDPHEGISRLEYREGMNLQILGHDGAPLLVQIADADHGPLSSTFVVDERARDAMAVDAILARDRDARRTPAARPGNPTKLAQLDRNQIVQYEDESKAGVVPRVAINGSAGLWTVLPIFVSQTGQVAKMTFQTTPPTRHCVSIYGRPITANQQAAFVPDPLTDGDGWRDNEVTLLTRYGWIDSWGEPGQRAGYSPWQETDGHAVTGKLTDDAGFPFVSEFGGYLWVAIYAEADCFIEGRLCPGVPQ